MNTIIIILTSNDEWIESIKSQLVSYFGGRMLSYYTQLSGLPIITLNQTINDLDEQSIRELFNDKNIKFLIHEVEDIKEIIENQVITI